MDLDSLDMLNPDSKPFSSEPWISAQLSRPSFGGSAIALQLVGSSQSNSGSSSTRQDSSSSNPFPFNFYPTVNNESPPYPCNSLGPPACHFSSSNIKNPCSSSSSYKSSSPAYSYISSSSDSTLSSSSSSSSSASSLFSTSSSLPAAPTLYNNQLSSSLHSSEVSWCREETGIKGTQSLLCGSQIWFQG